MQTIEADKQHELDLVRAELTELKKRMQTANNAREQEVSATQLSAAQPQSTPSHTDESTQPAALSPKVQKERLRDAVADLLFSNCTANDVETSDDSGSHAARAQSARIAQKKEKKVARPSLWSRHQQADSPCEGQPDARLMLNQLLLEQNPLCNQWTSLDSLLKDDTRPRPEISTFTQRTHSDRTPVANVVAHQQPEQGSQRARLPPRETENIAPASGGGIVQLSVREPNPVTAATALQSCIDGIGHGDTGEGGVTQASAELRARLNSHTQTTGVRSIRDPSPLQGRVLYSKSNDAAQSKQKTRSKALPDCGQIVSAELSSIPAKHAPPQLPKGQAATQNKSVSDFIRVCGGGDAKRPFGTIPSNVVTQATEGSPSGRGKVENRAKVEALRQRCDEVTQHHCCCYGIACGALLAVHDQGVRMKCALGIWGRAQLLLLCQSVYYVELLCLTAEASNRCRRS